MADVDTENKRRSIDQLPGLEIYANPTGTIDVYERADATAIYAGFNYTVLFTGRIKRGLLMGVY
jgi:hypothetical protein